MAADTAAGRIMELSKKNRELTADLESERNKLRQMAKKMKEMEREVPNNEVLECVNFTIMLASNMSSVTSVVGLKCKLPAVQHCTRVAAIT